jgi:hypothetical protein
VGVQVGAEQAEVGQAQVPEHDGVAGVDVDPVAGAPHHLPGRVLFLVMSAGTGDRARGGVKETGEAADPPAMGIGDRIGRGRGGGSGRRWLRVRPRRPTGIRNGGLLLVLVALAAVLALVDGPPQPGADRRLPGIFQYLPPPVGIARTPPVVGQPLPVAGPTAAPADNGERPAAAERGHPRRTHPRPVAAGAGASGSSRGPAPGAGAEPAGDPGGSGPVAPPPVNPPPVAATPSARVRVPAVSARVKPPEVLGRDLPEVRVETPGRPWTWPPG